MSWEKVKIVAKIGTQFGVLYDENGELALVVKQPGEPWPHNLIPTSGQNQIGEECKAYVVITDSYYEDIKGEFNGTN